VTDPIADMLTRVRNAIGAKHTKVDVPASNLKIELARILKDEGYVSNYKVIGEGAHRAIRLYLKYGPDGEKIINRIERISKPGCRVYIGRDDIPSVLGGIGINIISTSRGVMTGRDARRLGVGGEILCRIY
jgi:small subunit ribosomal protein S8